jgi:hypothetical protein
MLSGVVYVTKLDSNELPSDPPEARKAFKRASDFKLETMSQSSSQIGGKCLQP